MSKLRSDSTWAALTPPQKEILVRWLFEENLGYDDVLERVRNEFGLTASKTSLAGYYKILAREQMSDEFSDAHLIAAEILGAEIKLPALREAALKITGKKLLECVLKPGMPRELPALANVLLASEQQEIQHAWLALAREKFEFKAAKAALKALPMADEMSAEDEARENARIQKIKLAIFGERYVKMAESGYVYDPAKPLMGEDGIAYSISEFQARAAQNHPNQPQPKSP